MIDRGRAGPHVSKRADVILGAPVKIAHVLSSFAVGGAEWVALRLAAEQQAEGHDVEVIALRDGPLREACEELGVRALAFGGRSVRLAAAVAMQFARKRYDVVNSHNPDAHRYARLCRTVGFAPLVMTRHGEIWHWRRMPRLFATPVTDAVIAVSKGVRDVFLNRYPRFPAERIVIIDNGVPIQPPGGDEALRGIRRPGHTLLYLTARLDPVKDLDTLLRAVAIARRTAPVQLAIAGDGPDRDKLEMLARELGITDNVAFLGFRDDAVRLYAAADMFVLSSITEGMSLSMLEAMAASLPVVATNVGGNPEVVLDGETGLLVPPRDPAGMAAAICRLCTDVALRKSMGVAGRARVDEHFSLRATTRRYLEVYERLLAVGPLGRARGSASLARV